MILPFSRSRSRTSLSSNCLYCASLTPRAMFSKSMNIASFRSPFIRVVLSSALLSGGVGWVSPASIICPSFGPPGQVYDLPHEKARSRRGRPGAARPGPDREVARPDVWPHAPLRSQTLDLPLLRPGGAPDVVDVGGVPAPAADHRALRRPLRHALVEARQRVGGRLRALARRAGDAAGGGGVRAPARGSRLHDQHAPRRSAGQRRGAGGEAQREGPRARPRRPDAPGAAEALLLEVVQVAARLRAPRREPARLLGAERLPHARRPLDRGALLRPGDARDAADARRGRTQASRPLSAPVRVTALVLLVAATSSAGCLTLLAGNEAPLERVWQATHVWLPPGVGPENANGRPVRELESLLDSIAAPKALPAGVCAPGRRAP